MLTAKHRCLGPCNVVTVERVLYDAKFIVSSTVSPFPSGTGEMYGALFKLSKAATGRLNSLSNANIGRFLVAQANGRVVDGVLIDKPVNDGFIVIWKGLTQEDIKLFDKVLPRIENEKDKKNKKKD